MRGLKSLRGALAMAADYTAPVADLRFCLEHLCNLEELATRPGFEEATPDMIAAVLEEAGRFAGEVLGPLNWDGDRQGAQLIDGKVQLADGFAEAYAQFVDNGWPALDGPTDFGGQGMPKAVGTAVNEMWHSANMAFALGPMLTQGAIDAVESHADEALRATYLEKMVSGEWSGTMNLTEPQAGSDLSAVRSKAVPEGDHYRISGQKIFITWGEHEAAENIVHLVLARLPDAPEGTRGISLFLVPKYLVNEDGSRGELNDLRAVSLEHKLGIHASPTCVMSFGDEGGAVGYLVGEENKGLACMFTMMNAARLGVGLQGVSIGERAYQAAASYAKERVQGGAPGHQGRVAIIEHADVRRMLLTMRALVEAGRALSLVAQAAFDRVATAADEDERKAQQARVDLLTPIVKAWATENGQEVASLGVQVHGGMGYIEETGAAQHLRDARITTIYEGTTGIQALDLVGRKTLRDGGVAMRALVAEMHGLIAELEADGKVADLAEPYSRAVAQAEAGLAWLLEHGAEDPEVPASVAVPYLMLQGTVCGAWVMTRAALAASRELASGGDDEAFLHAKLVTARFYLDHVAPRAMAFLATVEAGSRGIGDLASEAF
jgi:alkylation response protein AidB-like acyl-CoA dehydrogenase